VDEALSGLVAAVAGLRLTPVEVVAPKDEGTTGVPPVPVAVVRVKAAQRSVTLVAGQTFTVPAVVYLSDGRAVASQGFTWKSSNTKAVKVNKSTGKVRGVRPGSVTVTGTAKTATAGGTRLTVAVRVKVVAKAKAARVKRVTATSVPKTLPVGGVRGITGKYTPAGATSVKVTYSSSRPGVASVDKAGTITAKAPGQTVITVKAGTKSKKYTVTITTP
jgi:uncharacterized protein YjdB